MNPSQLADLLGVAPNTIRRWCNVYADFLTPSAKPKKGEPRRFSRFDQRVLYFVAALRQTTPDPIEEDQIISRLKTLQAAEWRDLPELPLEFGGIEDMQTLEVVPTEQRAREIATVEFLQRENRRLEIVLEEANQRLAELEAVNAELQASQTATEAEKHKLQIDLERTRGQVAALEARLSGYAITGGDKPIPVASIVAVTALAAVIIVLVILVVVRLVL